MEHVRKAAFGRDVRFLNDLDRVLDDVRALSPSVVVLSADLDRGYAICRKLKKDAVAGQVRVVLVSARATEQEFADHARLPTRADSYFRGVASDPALSIAMGFEPGPPSIEPVYTAEPEPANQEIPPLPLPASDAPPPLPDALGIPDGIEMELDESAFEMLEVEPIPEEVPRIPHPTAVREGSWDMSHEVPFEDLPDADSFSALEGSLGTDPGLAFSERSHADRMADLDSVEAASAAWLPTPEAIGAAVPEPVLPPLLDELLLPPPVALAEEPPPSQPVLPPPASVQSALIESMAAELEAALARVRELELALSTCQDQIIQLTERNETLLEGAIASAEGLLEWVREQREQP